MKVQPVFARGEALLGEETTNQSPEYQARFLRPDWQQKREETIGNQAGLCAGCGRSGIILQVHHLSYRRLGREQWYDLMAVCKECHPYADRLRKQRKALGEQNIRQVKHWARIMGHYVSEHCTAGEWAVLRYFWMRDNLPEYIRKEKEREAQDALAVSQSSDPAQAVRV